MKWEPDTANLVVGSFMPVFKRVCEGTTGAVLELGGGYFSTPYIASLHPSRVTLTYEWDEEWAAAIREQFPAHDVVTNFDDIPVRRWAVVLIDCEGWNRYDFMQRLRPLTRLFVVHDSQDHWIPDEYLNSFVWREDFDADPRTTLVRT